MLKLLLLLLHCYAAMLLLFNGGDGSKKAYRIYLCAALLRSAEFDVHGNEETLNQRAQVR